MKALVFTGYHQMRLQDRPMPVLEREDSVIVRVRAMGICGSDLHIYHGRHAFAQYPIVPGHEIVGEVYQTGPAVTTLAPGDHVVLEPIRSCGSCYPCRRGRGNVCENLWVIGAHCDGGCQEYYAQPEQNWHKIPEQLPWTQAVMIEPYTIGAQMISRGQVGPDDTVLIHGAGPVGLIALDMAKQRGARVVVAEMLEKRLELAAYFGADKVIDVRAQDTAEEVMRWTDGHGPTVDIDCAGLPNALEDAAKILSPAGTIVTMTFSPDPTPIQVSLITLKELTIVGSRLQAGMFKPVIEGMRGDRLKRIGKMITHTFPIDQAEQAVLTAASGNPDVGKVVITFD